MTRPIRWLHLSDLHYGCPGKELWEQVEGEFLADLDQWCERLGPPDLLLFTGDLAYSGQAEEYKQVDAFLDDVLEHLQRSGAPEPILVAVPGNHDIAWPQGREALTYRILRSFDGTTDDPEVATLHQEFWRDQDASLVRELLPAYSTWFEQRIRPQLAAKAKSAHFSHFPNDFTAVVEPDGAFPLTLVGLNSTWLQYTGGDFDGKLLVPLEQFRAALAPQDERKPYDSLQGDSQTLLLQHHPPAWLSLRARDLFDESIYKPSYFSACLFGHLHRGNSTLFQSGGGQPRVFLQSPSLCGLEHWGKKNEDRAFGYTWGQLTDDGEIRLWPRKLEKRADNDRSFGHDPAFHEDADGVVLRPGARSSSQVAVEQRGVNLRGYLAGLIQRTGTLEIRGVAAQDSLTAIAPPIENLYTPLRMRGGPSLGQEHEADNFEAVPSPNEVLHRGGSQVLQTILRQSRRVLIEGDPGAGKTTFLRLLACMLARDAAGHPCPGGGSWARQHLGLDFSKPPIPIFQRLAALEPLLRNEEKPDDRERILDLLAEDWQIQRLSGPCDRDYWRQSLEKGEAWLLLDGLDEVADSKLRQKLFAIVRDAAESWTAPIVVASRPFQTEAMKGLGFDVAVVEPFQDREIESFLDFWVAAVQRQDPERASDGHSGSYRGRLQQAILTRPKIRALARNPVMLTCLCVVHWNRGDLPDVRSRVYDAVIHWLLQARADLRRRLFQLEPDLAQRALSALSFEGMTAAQGKQSILEISAAEAAVRPVFERLAQDGNAVDLSERIRRWLLFECEASGILEELPGGRLRFWHLTFQEFLAALELARSETEDWWPVLAARFDQAQWWETTELFATCLYDLGQPESVDLLLQRLLSGAADDFSDGANAHSLGALSRLLQRWVSGDKTTSPLRGEARRVGIIGRLLQPLKICGYRPAPELQRTYEAALDRTLEIFALEGAAQVPVEERIAAAEALGRGGDPRLRPEVDNFRAVPGTSLELGRYPVTVKEYQAFVDARGYEARRWWAEGWEIRKEHGWETPGSWEEQLEAPNRPVTGVSWWEAVAYCRWLSNQCRRTIRLPTEEEWHAAATHPGGGEYPWGAADPTPELANFDQSNAGHPTPVGIYPAGAGAYGHLDLAGNVWEWCSDEINSGARPLRGGAWWFEAVDLRSANRDWDEPDDRDDSVGFRVCRPSPSTVSGSLDS